MGRDAGRATMAADGSVRAVRLPPFKLERHFAKHEFSVRRSLSSSDCEPLSQRELLATADAEVLALWENLRLAYTESRGLPLLRREIAALHEGASGDDVLEIVPEEGIFLAMQAIVASGDHVVCTAPGYQSLHEIARSLGAQVSLWPVDERADGGWTFDPQRLKELLAARKTKLVVVNFPHNPTGFVPTATEWAAIVALVRDAGARLFSDEMYRTLELDRAPLPSAVSLDERAVVLGGVSKTLAAPGLRVGWLVTKDRVLLDAVAEQKDWTTICGSAPSEILALAALRARAKLLERSRALVRRSLDAVDALVAAKPGLLRWQRPPGGSIGLARLLGEPATAFCDRLLREKSLLLLPSTLFDFGDAHVRFGLGRADFPEALDELRAWLG